jgi:hypothetical protein
VDDVCAHAGRGARSVNLVAQNPLNPAARVHRHDDPLHVRPSVVEQPVPEQHHLEVVARGERPRQLARVHLHPAGLARGEEGEVERDPHARAWWASARS